MGCSKRKARGLGRGERLYGAKPLYILFGSHHHPEKILARSFLTRWWNEIYANAFFFIKMLKQRVYYKYSVKYKYKKFLFKFDETVWFLELCNRLQLVCFCHEFLIFRQQQKDSNWDDNCESWIQGLRNMMTERITWASCHLATLVTREVVPQTQTLHSNNRNLMKRNLTKIKSHHKNLCIRCFNC